jgi:hypothetical protein
MRFAPSNWLLFGDRNAKKVAQDVPNRKVFSFNRLANSEGALPDVIPS